MGIGLQCASVGDLPGMRLGESARQGTAARAADTPDPACLETGIAAVAQRPAPCAAGRNRLPMSPRYPRATARRYVDREGFLRRVIV